MRRRTVALVAALLLAGHTGVATVEFGARPEVVQAAGYNPDAEECKVLAEINQYRRTHGKSEVRLDAALGQAAEFRSADMAKKDYFAHRKWKSAIRRFGYDGSPIGENIAAATNGESAGVAMKMWIKSKPHRQTMLNGNFKAIGVGRELNKGARYDWYWTTTFGGEVENEVRC